MDSKKITPHRWNDEDDAKLEASVQALACGLPPKAELWSAVVGRMAPEILVTPQAARSRYGRLVEARLEAQREESRQAARDAIRSEAERPLDAWELISRRVEELEEAQADRIETTVYLLREDAELLGEGLARLERKVDELLRAWT
jgi:translation initiation factor RLI1